MLDPAAQLMLEANSLAYYSAWTKHDFTRSAEFLWVKEEAHQLTQDWFRLSLRDRQEKYETLRNEMIYLGKFIGISPTQFRKASCSNCGYGSDPKEPWYPVFGFCPKCGHKKGPTAKPLGN